MTVTMTTKIASPPTRQSGVFHSGFTRELTALAVGLTVSGGVVLQKGLEANTMWPNRHRGDGLVVAGVVMLLACVCAVLRRLRCEVRIGKQYFTCRKWTKTCKIAWSDMDIFNVSPPGSKVFRHVTLGTVFHTVSVDSLAFADFDEIVKLASLLRQRERVIR